MRETSSCARKVKCVFLIKRVKDRDAFFEEKDCWNVWEKGNFRKEFYAGQTKTGMNAF